MITQREAYKLSRLIRNLLDSAVTYSWRGGGDPEDVPQIEEAHLIAIKKVNGFIKSLTETP